MSTRRPLEGVRVLDLTRLLPGAYATLLMADLGAEVVKLEDPRGGDPSRAMPPLSGGTSVYFRLLNRNKRSVTIDLRSPDARAVVDALASGFDVLAESFRPHTARRLGVDAASIRARHPRLIHASITGFGETGPYAERAAHDINYEALSGILGVTRPRTAEGAAPPEVPRSLLADIGAAMNGAAGILAALYARERTGQGAAVDVSIHESALAWLLFPAARDLVPGGDEDTRDLPIGGRHACYNIYRAADDRYLALGALEHKFWKAFCERVGRPEWVARQETGGPDQASLLAEVGDLMRSRPRAAWLALFSDIDICLTPVNGLDEALADPHLAARGAVARFDGITYPTTPIAVTDRVSERDWLKARALEIRPAPTLGADTDAVLAAVGLDAAARAALRARGVI